MTTPNDGGPAFPNPPTMLTDDPSGYWTMHPAPGMSLRDWFAGQALAGAMTDVKGLGNIEPSRRRDMLHEFAALLFEVADALLAARAGKASDA